MLMRVITGTARGRRLLTPDGADTVRPTSEKVKEAIFSAIQFDIEGRRVLDLFAGSGQLGIEALSRGAASAVFVDSSGTSLGIVKKNLEITGFSEKATVISGDYSAFLLRCDKQFDIVFLDPPYKSGFLPDALAKVSPHLSDYGFVFCEHPTGAVLPDTVSGLKIRRTYKFGTVSVTMYIKDVTDDE